MASNRPLKNPSYEQISERARAIWESRGRPEGRDDEIWLDAERELQSDAMASAEEDSAVRSAEASPNTQPSSKGKNRGDQRRELTETRGASPEPSDRTDFRDPSNYADA